MTFYVGRNDCTGEQFECSTMAEAEAKIMEIAKIDPVGVERGDYYIDPPENWVGPGEECVED